MKAILPWTLLSALILSITLAIKPLTISLIESYASLYIDNNVTVTSLSFVDTELSLHVENESNTLNIKVMNLLPVLIDANYVGNINAFKKYHSLNGITQVYATIAYDKNLVIDARTQLYKSNTTFKLVYNKNDLNISSNIKDLDLDEFEKQNDKDLDLSGKLNTKLALHNNNFKIDGKLNLPYLETTKINIFGSYDEKNIKATLILKAKDEELILENILYDGDELSFETNYLKTPLYVNLLDNRVQYKASNLDLKVVFSTLKQEELIEGFVDISGKTNLRTMKNYITIDSKKITKDNISLNSLHVEAKSDINSTKFDLELALKNKALKLDGELSYIDDIWLKLNSSNFDSKSSFYFSNNKFSFISKHLNLQRLQDALDMDEEILGDVDVEASGSMDDIKFKISSNEVKILKISNISKPFLISMTGKFHKNKIYFSPYIKNENYILSRGKNIYDLKNKKLKLTQQLIVREKTNLVPIQIKADIKLSEPYEAKARLKNDNSSSNIDINLDKKYLFVKLEKLKLITLDNFIDKDSLFEKGYINGDITYNIQTKTAVTNIKIEDAILNGIDLDRSLSNLEDALGLNVVSLGRSIMNNYKDSIQKTYIKHLQLNTYLDHGLISLEDVALSTDKFRIAAFGNIEKDGTIKNLEASILDKQGCSLITQKLVGNIQNPKAKSTSTAIVGVASAIPSALLNTGRKIINFSAKTVDDVATYAVDKTTKDTKKISLASTMMTKSGNVLKSTYDIVLPNECKVIYDGKVKHPIQNKKK